MFLPCASYESKLEFSNEPSQDAGFMNFYLDFKLHADKLMKIPNKIFII